MTSPTSRPAGRQAEVAAVRTAIAAGRGVMIVGAAGIGKTAVATWALREVSAVWTGGLLSLRHLRFAALERVVRGRLDGSAATATTSLVGAVGDRLLVVEDLQWVHPDTADALIEGARQLQVVVTARGTEAVPPRLAAVLTMVHLEPLDNLAMRSIIRRALANIDAHAVREVLAAAEGNPLLAQALCRDGELSPSVGAALADRVARLPPEEREALLRASTLLRPVSPELLGIERGVPGLLRSDGPDLAVEPRVARALLAQTDSGDRQRVHAWLAMRTSGIEAARHHRAAGNLARAGELASELLSAPANPDERAEASMILAEQTGSSDDRWLAASIAASDAGRFTDAASAATRAVGKARSPDARARALLRLGVASWMAGDVHAARAAFDRGAAMHHHVDPTILARLLVEQAYLEIRTMERGGLARAEEVHRLAAAAGVEELRADAVLGAAMMYEMRPGWDDLLRQVLQDATAVGDLDLACTASHHLISGLGFLGRARETIDLCDQLLTMIGPDDSPAWYAHFECARLLNLARSSERLEWVTATAIAFGREHPRFRNRFQADIAAVLALLDTGKRQEARLRARAHELRGGDPSDEVYAAIAVAEVAWVDGDAGAIARCLATGRRHGDVWWGSRALIEVLGAYASWESDAAVTAERPVFVLPAMSPSLVEIDAVVAASAGRHAEAIARFDDAASAWTAVGAPRWSLRAQAAAAHVAALASAPDAARRATAVEHRASERQLSHLLLPWARFRNGRMLTPRERAVLRLVATGQTSADIARTLGISAATVNAHVASARTKTGATTRRAVVAR